MTATAPSPAECVAALSWYHVLDLPAALSPRGRERLLVRFVGVPHAAVGGRPAR